jgi:hypothetical protein
MYLIAFAGKEQIKILKENLDIEDNLELKEHISNMEAAYKDIMEMVGKTNYSV